MIKTGKTYIYLVENCYNDSNKVYIGKTKGSRKNKHKKTFGSEINYSIIDEVNSLNKKEWKWLESYWIEQFKQWGFEVMNKNKGGSGPEFMSEETKILIGEGNKGKLKPGVSRALKGGKNPGVIKARKGIPQPKSKETCTKISNSKKGMRMDNEWKSKISQSTKGNKNRLGTSQSKQTREKISKALRGRKRPKEVIEKLKVPKKNTENFGKHRKGIQTSPETIQKMKDASKFKMKPVIQYDLEGNFIREFPGINEASRITDIPSSAITMCCKGRLKTTNKTIFKYKN